MKNRILFINSLLSLMLCISACKKKDPESPEPVNCNYLVTEINTVEANNGTTSDTYKYVYTYNSSNKLIKTDSYKNGVLFAYDTIIYNSTNQIETVEEYLENGGVFELSFSSEYTYSGGNITSVQTTGENLNGAFVKTETYSYDGTGKLTGVDVEYSSGTPDIFELGDITNVTYTSSNVTSYEQGGITWTMEYDNYPNPDNQSRIISGPYDLSTNNLTKLYGDGVFIQEYSYTYQDGKVKTQVEDDGSGFTSTSTYTYDCR